MTNFWPNVAIFFVGIICGLVIYIKMKNPDTIINDNQRIGKIKSRGTGSAQTTSLVRAALDPNNVPAARKPLLDRIFPGRKLRRVTQRKKRSTHPGNRSSLICPFRST